MSSIFAHHAHVFPAEVKADGTIDRLLRLLDACGIERAVCFAPFAHQLTAGMQQHNQWLAGHLRGQDRLVGFGTLNFKAADLPAQVREVADLGFKGIKLHPAAQTFDILAKEAFSVYETAQELDLILTFHTGVHHHRIKEYAVVNFDEIAWHFPKLRFTMEHVGGYHFFNEALAVIVNNFPPPWIDDKCRIFGGLASVFTQHQNRFWYLRPDQIAEVIAQTSATQLIFGLDFPYNLERETKMGIETIRALPISREAQDLILGGNLRRELGLES